MIEHENVFGFFILFQIDINKSYLKCNDGICAKHEEDTVFYPWILEMTALIKRCKYFQHLDRCIMNYRYLQYNICLWKQCLCESFYSMANK